MHQPHDPHSYGGHQTQPQYGTGGVAMHYGATTEDPDAVAHEASSAARARFIERTYLHLAGAIAAFVVLETVLVNLPGIDDLVMMMLAGQYSWLVVLGLFMAVSWIADKWAKNSTSLGMQYAGLALYTIAEAIIFVPLIYIAINFAGGPELVLTAGGTTLAMFAAMTGYVFITKKDFSFMKGFLAAASMAALAVIVGSIFLGFSLGLLFCVAMVLLASGYILYYTSNVIHHYRTTQHVAAALALFSALALLFWYILQIFMKMRR
jgi:hypothetical protein